MDTQALVAMRIQQLCAEHGYNLNQLARSCGVPPSTVKNIIHGASHNPGIVTIKLLCDGLGISLYDFFNTDDFRQHYQAAHMFCRIRLSHLFAYAGRNLLPELQFYPA